MDVVQIALPVPPIDTYAFEFSASAFGSIFKFVFKFFDSHWNVFVTLGGGEIREAGCFPDTLNWKGFTDYRLAFMSTLASIGINDLASVDMFVLGNLV